MYDDYALNPEVFELMAKEYNQRKKSITSLSVSVKAVKKDDVDELFKKIEYLRVLIGSLKSQTKNIDTISVLDRVLQNVKDEQVKLFNLFDGVVLTSSSDDVMTKIFCNSLKLAIDSTGEIVKCLIKIKDDDETFELSSSLTESINTFLDVNSMLVSLFGECRYRVFRN